MGNWQKARKSSAVHETFENGAVIIGGDFQGLGIARNLAPLRIPVIIVDPDFCIGRFSRFVQEYYRCPPLTDMEAFLPKGVG